MSVTLACTLLLGLLVVAKRYEPRYLIALSVLLGASGMLAFSTLAGRFPRLRSRKIVVVVAIVSLAAVAVKHAAVVGRWRAIRDRAATLDRLTNDTPSGCVLLTYGAASAAYALWLGDHQVNHRFGGRLQDRDGLVLNAWDRRIETVDGTVRSQLPRSCSRVVVRGRLPRDSERRNGVLQALQSADLIDRSLGTSDVSWPTCPFECALAVDGTAELRSLDTLAGERSR